MSTISSTLISLVPRAQTCLISEQTLTLSWKNFFFGAKKKFQVEVWDDPNDAWSNDPGLLNQLGNKLYTDTMALGSTVLIDAEGPNKDKFVRVTIDSDSWQKELDTITAILGGS